MQTPQTPGTRVNVRLSGADAENFQHLIQQSGDSVSNIVRAALHAYGAHQLSPAPDPAHLLSNFVAAGEGPEDLSVNAKYYLADSLAHKHDSGQDS